MGGVIVRVGPIQIDKIILELRSIVDAGALKAAQAIATGIQKDAREELYRQVMDHGGSYTGNLASAIVTKSGDTGLPGHARWDVIIDESRAPYAAWIEVGKRAGHRVPYAGIGTRDYSESSFTGYRFLDFAVKKYTQAEVYGPIVSSYIIAEITKKGNNPLRRL